MIRSMTAFGSARLDSDAGSISAEIRSVNNRFLDLSLRIPEDLRFAESRLRDLVGRQALRGKVELKLSYAAIDREALRPLDPEAVRALAEQLQWARRFIPDLPAPTLGATLILLFVTIVAGGGLAAMHVNLLVTRSVISLSREEIAWMLSLCGLGMLAAQIFHARLDWLVTMPRRLAGLTLGLLAAALFLFPVAASMAELSGIIVAAGWSSATLRLVTSFWISGAAAPSGLKLGLQHSAASIGQALAPLAIAVVAPGAQHLVLWGIGGLSLALLVSLPLAWRPRAIVKSSA